MGVDGTELGLNGHTGVHKDRGSHVLISSETTFPFFQAVCEEPVLAAARMISLALLEEPRANSSDPSADGPRCTNRGSGHRSPASLAEHLLKVYSANQSNTP